MHPQQLEELLPIVFVTLGIPDVDLCQCDIAAEGVDDVREVVPQPGIS